MTRLTHRIDPRGEAGMTLPEVLVACVVGMVILLAAFAVLDSVVRVNGRVTDRVDAVERGRLAIDEMVRDLRSQVCPTPNTLSLASGSDTSVSAYVDLKSDGSAPQLRTFTYDAAARTITQTTVAPSGAASAPTYTATPTTRVLLTNVVADGTTPVFRFYAADPTATPPGPTRALTATSGLSALDLGAATRIAISFVARPARATTTERQAAYLQNDVYLRAANPNASSTPTVKCS
ncbi:MAG: hypothetical protein QOF04_2359 [Solirubrobacteraceae bacterium]|jgi:Tfp pilus assembly protein PilW|nr:hypothetical protein [Solirubrobacteraceae bacterium]